MSHGTMHEKITLQEQSIGFIFRQIALCKELKKATTLSLALIIKVISN